ncbi:MAG TPA: S8 family serine peptidase [Allosphingosinicella sp.]|jgi:subtilisin family serine protease
MRTLSFILALCLALAAAACHRLPWASRAEKAALEQKVAPDVRRIATLKGEAPVIVRLDVGPGLDSMTPADRATAIERASADALAEIPSKEVRVVHRYQIVPIVSAWASPEGLVELARRPGVKEIVLDRLDAESLDKSVRLIGADSVWPTSTGLNRYVAILDTGIDRAHPFFGGRVAFEACFRKDGKCPVPGYAQIGTGAAQSITRGHGTHVAGIAAGGYAVSSGIVLKGVAPGAKIIAINVFSAGGSYVGDQVKALEHVAMLKQTGISVVAANLSLGDGVKYVSACDFQEKERKPVIDRLLALGVATVVAAGNESQSGAVSAPGCISSAVTVSAVTNADKMSPWHNRSRVLTDLAAPGEQIRSSMPNGQYADDTGTSMAAPHVSGAIALLSSAAPTKSLNEILGALSSTGTEITDPATGVKYRRINVRAALAQLTGN